MDRFTRRDIVVPESEITSHRTYQVERASFTGRNFSSSREDYLIAKKQDFVRFRRSHAER
jgi:hypothetical protein